MNFEIKTIVLKKCVKDVDYILSSARYTEEAAHFFRVKVIGVLKTTWKHVHVINVIKYICIK